MTDKSEQKSSPQQFYDLPAHATAPLAKEAQQEVKPAKKKRREYNPVAALYPRLFVIILIAFLGFYAYRAYYTEDKQLNTLADLEAALPLNIDKRTVLERIEDNKDEFKMVFVKDPEAYANLSYKKREESLNRIVNNSKALCGNKFISAIIEKGKKVTVILNAKDGSFHRSFTLDQCKKTEP